MDCKVFQAYVSQFWFRERIISLSLDPSGSCTCMFPLYARRAHVPSQPVPNEQGGRGYNDLCLCIVIDDIQCNREDISQFYRELEHATKLISVPTLFSSWK
jgi:hypothetical protein